MKSKMAVGTALEEPFVLSSAKTGVLGQAAPSVPYTSSCPPTSDLDTMCGAGGVAYDGAGGRWIADTGYNRVVYYPLGQTSPTRVFPPSQVTAEERTRKEMEKGEKGKGKQKPKRRRTASPLSFFAGFLVGSETNGLKNYPVSAQ